MSEPNMTRIYIFLLAWIQRRTICPLERFDSGGIPILYELRMQKLLDARNSTGSARLKFARA